MSELVFLIDHLKQFVNRLAWLKLFLPMFFKVHHTLRVTAIQKARACPGHCTVMLNTHYYSEQHFPKCAKPETLALEDSNNMFKRVLWSNQLGNHRVK